MGDLSYGQVDSEASVIDVYLRLAVVATPKRPAVQSRPRGKTARADASIRAQDLRLFPYVHPGAGYDLRWLSVVQMLMRMKVRNPLRMHVHEISSFL
jgi:hypothetical protein